VFLAARPACLDRAPKAVLAVLGPKSAMPAVERFAEALFA
jgi:hypothetical protein